MVSSPVTSLVLLGLAKNRRISVGWFGWLSACGSAGASAASAAGSFSAVGTGAFAVVYDVAASFAAGQFFNCVFLHSIASAEK